jgi:hypothetical protein
MIFINGVAFEKVGRQIWIVSCTAPLHRTYIICKTKSRLRRRHCGLARHFKTDPTETVALCFGYAKTLQLTMKALWPGASFQNRSYKYRSSLFWIREDTSAVELMTNRWTGQIYCQCWAVILVFYLLCLHVLVFSSKKFAKNAMEWLRDSPSNCSVQRNVQL